MVELSRDDWTRLTSLIHTYGSVDALEQAIGHRGRQASGPPRSIDLTDMVRIEVAHQLGRSPSGRPPEQAALGRLGSPAAAVFSRCLPWLWPASGVAWISLTLILIGGVAPLRAAATGVLAVLGFHVGLRRDGRIGWWLWQAIAAVCVITWAVASSWPIEASAVVLGSVLAGCIGPLRSKLGHSDAL